MMTTMEASRSSVTEVLEKHSVDAAVGLSQIEVEARQRIYGYNEMEEGEQETLCEKFMDQFKEPLIVMLLSSALISALMRQFDDAISIAAAVIIVSTVAFIQEYRSEKSLEALNRLVPPKARVSREGRVLSVMARELVPGDVVEITVGDRIPADCRVLSCTDLMIDESSLTGEDMPAEKSASILLFNEAHEVPIAERTNIVHMGTLVCNGHGRAVVVGTAMRTEFGRTFEEMRDMEHRRTPLQVKMDGLAKQISMISIGVILVIGLLGFLQGKGLLAMFQIGVSLAVAAIPEGLPICVTVTLALGVMRMAKRNAIVKKLPSVEALGCATVVCVDKTGTLTQNQMTVKEVFCPALPGRVEFGGVGYGVTGKVTYNDSTAADRSLPPLICLLEAACVCNNARLERANGGDVLGVTGQPTEAALLVAAAKFGVEDPRPQFERVSEVAFSSDRKYMEVQCQRGPSTCTFIKGMVEAVLPSCDTYIGPDGVTLVELRDMDRQRFIDKSSTMASGGLRVLAVAYGLHGSRKGLTFAGLVGMMDPPRVGVRDSIALLRQSKIRVAMITGDSKETAEHIAHQLGFYERGADLALSGHEIETMPTQELEAVIQRVAVFYRTSPRHKLAIVRALQADGEIVAMTGDGVNDAAALKQAEIGVAMGRSGTDVAKEAADMILVEDDFSTITYAVEEGKSIFYNIKNFLTFQLSTSVAALSIVALATLGGLDCPLNAMQILWINIIMDGPPAQSLGVEPVDPAVMRRPPRRTTESIINSALAWRVLTNAALITAGTLFVFHHEMGHDGVVSRRDTTMTFTTFVFFDMFNAMACRHAEKPIIFLNPLGNTSFVVAIGLSVIGQLLVIYFPPLQEIFQTEALSLGDLAYITCLTSTLLVLDTARKVLFKPGAESSIAEVYHKTVNRLLGPRRRHRAARGPSSPPHAIHHSHVHGSANIV